MIENENKIQMLGFKSDKKIMPQYMYKYKADYVAPSIDSNKTSCLNSIAYGFKKFEEDAFIMNNDEFIFSTKKISETERICKIENKDILVKLVAENYDKIPLSETKIYENYLRDLCKRNILNNNKKFEKFDYDLALKLDKNIPNISCLRIFKIDIELLDDGYFLLYVKLSTKFASAKTVLDMKRLGENIYGRNVRYTGFHLSKPFSGILTKEESFDTPMELKTVEGLEKYYKNRYPNYKFYHKENDFVAHLLTNENKNINFLASMLSPIWSFEEIKSHLGDKYSKLAREITLLKPNERFKEGQIIPKSVGVIKELDNVSFVKNSEGFFKYIEPKDACYDFLEFNEPELLIGNNKVIEADPIKKREVLRSDIGYYFLPKFDEKLRIALVATNVKTKKEHMERLTENIFKRGLYNFFPKDRIEFFYTQLLYDNYGIFANKLKNAFNPHIAFVTLSNNKVNYERDNDTYEEVYPSLKEAFAECKIPSQMITSEQIGKIYTNNSNSKWISFNIIFGILGKLGAIPYSLKDNIKNIDIFLGLDVGKYQNGIHYPALGAAFMGDGKFMGGFCNQRAISGEKIPYNDLKNILNKVISLFFEKTQRMPKRMVIHRDGFSREDDKWYDEFFGSKNMEYALIEVIKSGAPRVVIGDVNDADTLKNAPVGAALFRGNECILVTTDPIGGTSAPITIRLRKENFGLSLKEAAQQIYNLSKINAASNHNTRLPITTKYADIISKHPTYIPCGEITSALYWI